MNIITNLKHYVSTSPYREEKKYKVGEKHFKNGIEYTIKKIEGDFMVIKSKKSQFCVGINYDFTK